jgi:hypothetical protein
VSASPTAIGAQRSFRRGLTRHTIISEIYEVPMELDHVFVFVEPGGPEVERMRALGLVETYRRRHPGQGTENVCFAFENIYLELLWVNDLTEIRSAPIARTRLYERSRWQTEGTCRFGIAWRETGSEAAELGLGAPLWSYEPPYLPPGMSIAVAVDSDDPEQPLMFRSPGASAPSDWPLDRRGDLQRGAGLGQVRKVRLTLPRRATPSAALRDVAARTGIEVGEGPPSLVLEVERLGSSTPLVLAFPGAALEGTGP